MALYSEETRTLRELAVSLLCLVLTLAPLATRAQDSQNGGAEQPQIPTPSGLPDTTEIIPLPAPTPPGIEAIEVTGERIDATNVQDQASAITAFGKAELDRLHISNVDGLATNVPGLHVGQQGQNAIITLRGVGTENASLTGEPGVAFHVDGIYFGSPAAARTAFFDIETLDVRRGPQGLEGGKNSTSGAIHVNTKDPESEYQVSGDWLMGNYARDRGRGVINIPVGEYMAARFAVFYEQRDGFLDRRTVSYDLAAAPQPIYLKPVNQRFQNTKDDAFDLDNLGLRGKLRFTPAESLDLVVGYSYFKEEGVGPQADFVPLPNQTCPSPYDGSLTNRRLGYPKVQTQMGIVTGCKTYRINPYVEYDNRTMLYPVTPDTDPRKIYSDFGSQQNDEYYGFSSKLQWDTPELPALGETQLKLLGGVQHNKVAFNWDFDGTDQELFNLMLDNKTREYTGELQWSGGDLLTWQTSLFYQHQKGSGRTLSPKQEIFPDPTTSRQVNLSNYDLYNATVGYDSEQHTKVQSYGAAIHGNYAFSDSLSLGLGGRLIKDEKESFLATLSDALGNNMEACAPKGVRLEWKKTTFQQDVKSLTPSGFASEPLPHCSATFRGKTWGSRLEWKPGDSYLWYAGIDRGFKSGGFASGGGGTYKPEKIWAYTLGTKNEFFDSRLQMNLEGFFYNYTDMQLALLDGTRIRTENTDAKMYGWELEMRAAPIESLRLQGLISYLHTETFDYFTLDPAALGFNKTANELGVPEGTDIVGLQLNRLARRETDERQGLIFPTSTDQCLPGIFCKDIGTSGQHDGLDDYSGSELSRSPQLKWNISAEYDIPLGRLGTMTPGVQYAWQDAAFFRVFNNPSFDEQKKYHTTNVRLSWTSPEQMWEAEVFVNNIEDNAIKQNILIGPRAFGSPPLAWYGEPRFYGARIGFKY